MRLSPPSNLCAEGAITLGYCGGSPADTRLGCCKIKVICSTGSIYMCTCILYYCFNNVDQCCIMATVMLLNSHDNLHINHLDLQLHKSVCLKQI